MFDWNGNGKHDAFDDFVTFGLVHHIIEDSKKNKQPPAAWITRSDNYDNSRLYRNVARQRQRCLA